MHWNQFGGDHTRATALGEVLLGAAHAGNGRDLTTGDASDARLAVAYGQVAKALGVSELPAALRERMRRFDPAAFDLAHACAALALDSARDRVAVMKSVALVVHADGAVAREARVYALRLATLLGLSYSGAVGVVGLPSRPLTGPRPRPVTGRRVDHAGRAA